MGLNFMRVLYLIRARRKENACIVYNCLMFPAFLALPPEQLTLLRLIADEAAARGVAAYLVGGVVRDLLLGRPGLDFDIVVVGDAVTLARALAKKHGGKVTAHPRFGTGTWKLDGGPGTVDGELLRITPYALDFITSRRETYSRPAALPEVTPSTLEDDLKRRDFTINTLAVRLDGAHFGELYDPHHGADDIARRIIRVLHPASFLDDPTRIFRAVRYEQRYGFAIAPETLALIPAARPIVAALSAERLRHEFDLIFDEPNAAQMLNRLDELGMLKAAENVLPWGADLRERLAAGLLAQPGPEWDATLRYSGTPFRQIVGYCLWLLDLSPSALEAAQTRLIFPLALLTSLREAARLRVDLPHFSGAAPSKWVERLRGVPLPAIYAVFLVSGEPALQTYAAYWQHIHPKTNGDALKALGVPPGPAYKKILLRLRAAWLDGEVASAQQEKALLEKLLAT